MAIKIKVKTIAIPNLDVNMVKEKEEELESIIKEKLENGYTLHLTAGGDNYVILIFKKEE
jgi:hypothetical protein